MKKTIAILLIASVIMATFYVFSPQVKVWAADGLGKALSFDGVSNYVSVPAIDANAYTFELWFKPGTKATLNGVIGSLRFLIQIDGQTVSVWYNVYVGQLSWYSLPITSGNWQHLAVIIDYTAWDVTVYLNGVNYGTLAAPVHVKPPFDWMTIGTYYDRFYDGALDEVRIYEKKLTNGEITAHYNSGEGQYGRPELGLAAGWHFDEGAGDVVHDYSGNGKHGTRLGASWVEGHVHVPDIEITSVSALPVKAIKGNPVSIPVTVKNSGTPYEAFTVSIYYDTTLIDTKSVPSLAPGASTTLSFSWDTTGAPLGHHTIKAEASTVEGETNTANNKKTDGDVWIVDYPTASFMYSPVQAIENASTTFDASGSTPNGGTIVDYEWDFGDGNVTHTSNSIIMHVYASHGMYTVTLTVTDDEDLDDTTSQDVEVLRHDIAIAEVLPCREWIYEERSVNVNVTVTNEGNFTETATVDLYYNVTENKLIGTQLVMLDPDETETLTFTWDTTGIPHARNYTITAVATIAFDSDLTDNAMNGTTKIHVRILGDMNGDNKVDLKDFWILGGCFGHCQGQPDWNPDADLNFDNRVDVKDIFKFGKQYGHVG
jgi:PKD repeat protein